MPIHIHNRDIKRKTDVNRAMSEERQIYIYDLHDAENAEIETNISLNVVVIINQHFYLKDNDFLPKKQQRKFILLKIYIF